MKMLFVADLHYTLKQFDWVMANATKYDPIIIGGDLLDLSSALDPDIQIAVIEKYLYRLLQETRVVVCSGNHDLDSRNAAGEAVAGWLYDAKAANLFLDGISVELSGALLTICPWWDGAVSRAEVEAELALPAGMIKRPWIWVYHAPPAGSAVCWNGRKFVGALHPCHFQVGVDLDASMLFWQIKLVQQRVGRRASGPNQCKTCNRSTVAQCYLS
ncbi:MAG TPA: metallophosphoesterase [Chthoniobacterales bacterium]|nr:metallophosphoesterase [Chthoniobacterales bacterium]